jgi:hypothetical protein
VGRDSNGLRETGQRVGQVKYRREVCLFSTADPALWFLYERYRYALVPRTEAFTYTYAIVRESIAKLTYDDDKTNIPQGDHCTSGNRSI